MIITLEQMQGSCVEGPIRWGVGGGGGSGGCGSDGRTQMSLRDER